MAFGQERNIIMLFFLSIQQCSGSCSTIAGKRAGIDPPSWYLQTRTSHYVQAGCQCSSSRPAQTTAQFLCQQLSRSFGIYPQQLNNSILIIKMDFVLLE